MNKPSNIKKASNMALTLHLDRRNFLAVGNLQYFIVRFAASFQGRSGRPMFHHL